MITVLTFVITFFKKLEQGGKDGTRREKYKKSYSGESIENLSDICVCMCVFMNGRGDSEGSVLEEVKI